MATFLDQGASTTHLSTFLLEGVLARESLVRASVGSEPVDNYSVGLSPLLGALANACRATKSKKKSSHQEHRGNRTRNVRGSGMLEPAS